MEQFRGIGTIFFDFDMTFLNQNNLLYVERMINKFPVGGSIFCIRFVFLNPIYKRVVFVIFSEVASGLRFDCDENHASLDLACRIV